MSEQNDQQPIAAQEYSLTEAEITVAKRLNARVVMAKAAYSDSIQQLEQAKLQVEQLTAQVEGQKQAIVGLSLKASGWADGIAFSRGDADPDNFYLDTSNGTIRIVKG